MTLFKAPIVVIDTETTGFPGQAWSAICDLAGAVVECDGSLRAEPFQCLIRPEVLDARCEGAAAIHGLSNERLIRDGVAPGFALGLWRKWFAAQETAWMTSYNVGFDRPMVERMGIVEGRWANCVMLAATDEMGKAGLTPYKYGKYQWVKLEKAADFYGVELVQPAHRALSDARTAARVMVEIRRRRLEVEEIGRGVRL